MNISDTLKTALANFAKGYQVVALAKDLTEVARAAVTRRREWAADALTRKGLYMLKGAEKIANAHDVTFRAERRLSRAAVKGAEWEQVMAEKAPDLMFLIQSIISRVKAVEGAIIDPHSAMTPYLGYFEMKLEAAGRMFMSALQKVYNGGPAWKSFQNVREEVSGTWQEIMDLTGEHHVVSAAAITWAAEEEKKLAEEVAAESQAA
jgi:hypothetical protein